MAEDLAKPRGAEMWPREHSGLCVTDGMAHVQRSKLGQQGTACQDGGPSRDLVFHFHWMGR